MSRSLGSSPGFLVFWPFRANLVEERDKPSGSGSTWSGVRGLEKCTDTQSRQHPLLH